ncbi:MAG: Fe-S cluster assembly protein SufD [Bacteroidota bacterium]
MPITAPKRVSVPAPPRASVAVKPADLKDQLVEQFGDAQTRRLSTDTPYLRTIREEAIKAFDQLGFPTKRDEAWRYTNLRPILRGGFEVAEPALVPADIDLTPHLIPGLDAYLMVLVDGVFRPDLSDLDGLPDEVTLLNFTEAFEQEPQLTGEHFAKYADHTERAFVALNTAFATDGLFLHVPAGFKLERPVFVLYLRHTTDAVLASARNLVIVEDEAEATVIESFRVAGGTKSFLNTVTEFYVGDKGHVEHYKIQNEGEEASQFCATQAFQGGHSKFHTVTATVGGRLVRNELEVRHGGEFVDTQLHGLSLLEGQEHADHYTLVHHAQPNGHSNELYKNILDDSSELVFRGKLFVHPHAQVTNAYQSNQNLLLNDNASAVAQPQLEIYADDVRCSHGATTGHVEDEAVFYFRARGIPERRARILLMKAFLSEVTGYLENEAVQVYVDELVNVRFGA